MGDIHTSNEKEKAHGPQEETQPGPDPPCGHFMKGCRRS
jgi:hypothetical protein